MNIIKFRNIENNVELELSIVGYEFPNTPNDDWCLLKAHVIQKDNNFKVIDPALEAKDLKKILNWFKSLSQHKLPRYGSLGFIEPCIKFKFLTCQANNVRISINLSHELKPKFKLKQFGRTSNDWDIVFDLIQSDFDLIIRNLESIIQQYPVRDTSKQVTSSNEIFK